MLGERSAQQFEKDPRRDGGGNGWCLYDMAGAGGAQWAHVVRATDVWIFGCELA